MQVANGECYFTTKTCRIQSGYFNNTQYFFDTPFGSYALISGAMQRLDSNVTEKYKVAFVLANMNLIVKRQAIFVLESADELEGIAESESKGWTFHTVDSLLAMHPKNPTSSINRALCVLGGMTKLPSDEIKLNGSDDCWKLYSYDSKSLHYMLTQLKNLGYIDLQSSLDTTYYLTILAKGWEQKTDESENDKVFVAMSFDPSLFEVFDNGIRKSISDDCSLQCVRIDAIEHNEKICDLIISTIRQCKFLVADFSKNRGGIYYEAGYAHGMGLPVIFIAHESATDELHFDTRQYNHILYSDSADLRKKLTNRIKATQLG